MHQSFREGFEKTALSIGTIQDAMYGVAKKNKPRLVELVEKRYPGEAAFAKTNPDRVKEVLPGSSVHSNLLKTLRARHLSDEDLAKVKLPIEGRMTAKVLRRPDK
jgi:hypothetical protein